MQNKLQNMKNENYNFHTNSTTTTATTTTMMITSMGIVKRNRNILDYNSKFQQCWRIHRAAVIIWQTNLSRDKIYSHHRTAREHPLLMRKIVMCMLCVVLFCWYHFHLVPIHPGAHNSVEKLIKSKNSLSLILFVSTYRKPHTH